MTRVTATMIELDADEAYLLEALLAQPRTTLGNAIHWSPEDRRTTFHDCITGLMRYGLVHFRKDLCRMTLTGWGYRVLKHHRRMAPTREQHMLNWHVKKLRERIAAALTTDANMALDSALAAYLEKTA